MAEFASRPEEIARVLRDDILRGRYGPGERLPSERELAAHLDANRSSVREALKKLEQLRLIEIRRGGGARVSPVDEASLDVLGHLLALDDGPEGGHAQAALAASIFHFKETTVGEVKQRLLDLGIPVRPPIC